MTAPDLEIRNPKFIDHMVGHRSDSGIDGFLGAKVVEMEAGRLVVEFAVGDEHLTFIGNMHGGCLAALCDHCLGVVLYPVMPPRSWAACAEHLDEAALVELVVAIGNWTLFARLLPSLEVPLEDGVEPWPPDGRTPDDPTEET